jgi:hypothetical protein
LASELLVVTLISGGPTLAGWLDTNALNSQGETTVDSNPREKKVDLPPKGARNPDPITHAPGAHPIETGIGAAVAGAATGVAAGAAAGPAAAAVGAAAGAVVGGLAGKGIGELIDPTTEDNWLRDNFKSRPYVEASDNFDDFCPAFRYGALAESKYGDTGIDLTDPQLQRDWEASEESKMPWTKAKAAVRDAYDRTVQLRRQRCVREPRDAASRR